jgi:peptide deformylase
LRAVVVDVEQREGKPRLVELVNPEILESSQDLFEWEEGCLSFPGEGEKISRPARVRVRARDRRGQPFEVEAEKLFSIALQHEIDHLDGVLFIDHLSRLKRSLISRRMKKRAKTAAS